MGKEYWIGDVTAGSHDAKEVVLKGWIHRARGSNKIWFIVVRDSTGHVQCVAKRDVVGDECFESLRNALIESSVEITGLVEPTNREHGHEVQVSSATVIGPVNPDRPFPITESAMEDSDGGETEFLLDNRHLYLRTSRMTTMLKVRSTVFGAIHSYFRERDFTEYQAPNFVAGAVEGGSTLFEVPYFGKKAYLTQSWQLYAEAAMPALERLYTMAPSFRAEKSRTRRHLTEFWHAEMEVAWASNDEVMEHGEGVVRHVASTLLEERSEELEELGRDLSMVAKFAESEYPRMRYDEAIEILQSKGVEVEWGQDLDYSKEKILTSDFEVPHFLTHYPRVAKPFYHRPDQRIRNTSYVTTFWLLRAMARLSEEVRGRGPRRKYLRESTRREPLVSHTNSTSISGDTEESLMGALDWVLTGYAPGFLVLNTSERLSLSRGTAEGSLHRKW